jgi:tellurite resistance protein
MLPSQQERCEAVDIVRRIGYADGEITPEGEAVLERIERILGLHKPAEATLGTKAAPTRRPPKAFE